MKAPVQNELTVARATALDAGLRNLADRQRIAAAVQLATNALQSSASEEERSLAKRILQALVPTP